MYFKKKKRTYEKKSHDIRNTERCYVLSMMFFQKSTKLSTLSANPHNLPSQTFLMIMVVPAGAVYVLDQFLRKWFQNWSEPTFVGVETHSQFCTIIVLTTRFKDELNNAPTAKPLDIDFQMAQTSKGNPPLSVALNHILKLLFHKQSMFFPRTKTK